MSRLKDERQRTDQLLYQLLPKTVADQLRKGTSAVATCEVLFIALYTYNVGSIYGTRIGYSYSARPLPLQIFRMGVAYR